MVLGSRSQWQRALIVIAIGILALGLRLRAATLLPPDYDEDDYLRAGQLYALHLRAGDWLAITNERENYEHPPLTKLLFGAIIATSDQATIRPITAGKGSAPTSAVLKGPLQPLRQMGAVLGALTALVVALINPLAGLFVALNSWHIKYTSQAMLEALPGLTAALTLLFLRKVPDRRGLLWAAALTLGMTAAGKYLYAVTGIAAVWWLWYRGLRWPTIISWCIVALGAFVAANPSVWPAPIERLQASLLFSVDYSQGSQVTSAGFGWAQPLVWLLAAMPYHEGVAPLLLDGVLGALVLWRFRAGWRRDPLTSVWFATALLFLLWWPTKWPQYILTTTVPVALLAAGHIEAGIKQWRKERTRSKRQPEPGAAQFWRWSTPAGLLMALLALYPLLLQVLTATTIVEPRHLRAGTTGLWQSWGRGMIGLPTLIEGQRYIGVGGLVFALDSDTVAMVLSNVAWVTAAIGIATGAGLYLSGLFVTPGLRARRLWLLVFVLPWAIPEFVGALIWRTLLDDQFGAINQAFGLKVAWLSDPRPLFDISASIDPLAQWFETARLGPLAGLLEAVATLLSPSKAFWALVLVSAWLALPFMLLICVTARQALPRDVTEAAVLDGAGRWMLWRAILWPQLRPAIVTGMLLRGILLFNALHIPLMLVPEPQRVGTVPIALASYAIARYDNAYTASALLSLLGLAVTLGLAVRVLRQPGLWDEHHG